MDGIRQGDKQRVDGNECTLYVLCSQYVLFGKRGRAEADRLVAAANYQGFTKQQMEVEIGDICGYIRASIDTQNVSETARLRLEGQ
jgi:hypothetical protein